MHMWKSALGLALVTSAVLTGLVWIVATYGWGRTLVAFLIGLPILYLGFSYFTSVGDVPAEPEPSDVSQSELRYVCTMCGLELKIEVATTDRAPTHCREPMKLVQSGGHPPLRPVD